MLPKGKLLIIGGHEDKGEIPGENLKIHKKVKTQTHFEILGRLITRIPRARHVIVIIASASSIPREMEQLYIDSYKREGFTHVAILKLETPEEANDPTAVARVKGAHAVFFTGGDQTKLVKLIADTEILRAVKKKYQADKNFIVGGTSAGAMAIPELIISSGLIREALFKGDIKMKKGFDMIKEIIVDTHFIKRGRFARLAHAVTLHPQCLGIGLEENTALFISNGNEAECIGSGMIVLINGKTISSTNIKKVKSLIPIVVENLMVSILAEGSRYNLNDRKLLSEQTID